MPLPTPEPGLVINYGYLWYNESLTGQEEGIKDRPCAIILATKNEDKQTVVTVAAITHTPPQNLEAALAIPLSTKERLGLDSEHSWVILSEINRFIWPGPDLRPILHCKNNEYVYGLLPPNLFKKLKEKFVVFARNKKVTSVTRTE